MNAAPLDLALKQAPLQSFGMPDERLARMAARHAFVELKQVFMHAIANIDGATGERLQLQIGSATEAAELWHMRTAVWDALNAEHDTTTPHHRVALRGQLRSHLDTMFPQNYPDLSFMPL